MDIFSKLITKVNALVNLLGYGHDNITNTIRFGLKREKAATSESKAFQQSDFNWFES